MQQSEKAWPFHFHHAVSMGRAFGRDLPEAPISSILNKTARQPSTNTAGPKRPVCFLVRHNSGSPTVDVIGALSDTHTNFTKVVTLSSFGNHIAHVWSLLLDSR